MDNQKPPDRNTGRFGPSLRLPSVLHRSVGMTGNNCFYRDNIMAEENPSHCLGFEEGEYLFQIGG